MPSEEVLVRRPIHRKPVQESGSPFSGGGATGDSIDVFDLVVFAVVRHFAVGDDSAVPLVFRKQNGQAGFATHVMVFSRDLKRLVPAFLFYLFRIQSFSRSEDNLMMTAVGIDPTGQIGVGSVRPNLKRVRQNRYFRFISGGSASVTEPYGLLTSQRLIKLNNLPPSMQCLEEIGNCNFNSMYHSLFCPDANRQCFFLKILVFMTDDVFYPRIFT